MNPVLAEVTRGRIVESVHRGRAVIVAAGRAAPIAAWGDVLAPMLPRSACKALQAIPYVTSGAWGASGLGPEALALAAASHTAEPAHVTLAARMLTAAGCGPEALRCGPHPARTPKVEAAWRAGGHAPGPLDHMCSGKHAAMVATALHLGEDPDGYWRADHPVQRRAAAALAAFAGEPVGEVGGIDGCGIPTPSLSLLGLARSVAALTRPATVADGAMADAAATILAAWVAHPWYVAGTGQRDTELMEAHPGRLAVKGGAEGVLVAALPEDGVALAVKIDDGSARALDAIGAALLARLDLSAGPTETAILATTGETVGTIRSTIG